LRLKIEHCSLIVVFRGRKVQSPARSEVERKAIGDVPIVLQEEFGDAIAGPKFVLLEIDLECVHLSEQEASKSIAAVSYALLVRPGCGKRKGSGRIRWRHSVELVPAKVGACLNRMPSSRVFHAFHNFPYGGLKLREGASRRTELLKAGQGKQRQCIVERGVGG